MMDRPFGTYMVPGFIDALGCAYTRCRGRWMRKVPRELMFAYFHIARPVYDLEISKIRFRLHPGRNAHDRNLFLSNAIEEEQSFTRLLNGLPEDSIILDVGANTGVFSLFAWRYLGSKARIIAIDPHPDTFAMLADNIDLNSCDSIELANVGLGNMDGQLELLQTTKRNLGMNSFHDLKNKSNTVKRVKVDVVPLDKLCRTHDISRIDALKIDVEGYEDMALSSLLCDPLPSWAPHRIMLEHRHSRFWEQDLEQRLREVGYGCLHRDAHDALYELKSAVI